MPWNSEIVRTHRSCWLRRMPFSLIEMRFTEYETWLKEQLAEIVLEPGCVEVGPFLTPTVQPNRPPWQMDWTVIFEDEMYFRVTENWFLRKANLGYRGYRAHFCFHYGKANPDRDGEGIPFRSKAYPAIFRVDLDSSPNGAHIHFGGKDHVLQDKVHGFRISDAEMFEFIRAVHEHRATGKSFDEVMKFTVV